jgi:hypothetical protein
LQEAVHPVAVFVSVGAKHAREHTAIQQHTQLRNLWLTSAVLLQNKFDEVSQKQWLRNRANIGNCSAA